MEHWLFIGLGNPGSRYVGTRHNLGMAALQAWVEAGPKLSAHCLFPSTGMNNSGQAAAEFLATNKIPADHIVVIHDDAELPPGEVRLTLGGSAKGHNGVRSIQTTLGSQDFYRLRLGVGRPIEGIMLNNFVLEKFLPEEHEQVTKMIKEAVRILSNPLPPNPAGPPPF